MSHRDINAVNRVRSIKGRPPVDAGSDDELIENSDNETTAPLDSLSGGIDPTNDPGPGFGDALSRVRYLKRR